MPLHRTRNPHRSLAAALAFGVALILAGVGAAAGDGADTGHPPILTTPAKNQTAAKPRADGPPTVIGCSCSLGTGTCGKPNGKQCSAKGTCTGFCMKVWWAAPGGGGRALR